LYYTSATVKKKILLKVGNHHYGEVLAKGQQAVGPGSIHPNGRFYKIMEDRPIERISNKKLLSCLDGFYQTREPLHNPPLADDPKTPLGEGKVHDPDGFIETITPLWKEGTRNILTVPLCGYLIKAGIPEKETQRLLLSVAKKAKSIPRELPQWIQNQYQRVTSGRVKIKEISGISGLQHFLENEYNDPQEVHRVLSNIRLGVEGKPVVFVTSKTGAVRFSPKEVTDFLVKRHRFISRFSDRRLFLYLPSEGVYTPEGSTRVFKMVEELAPHASRHDKMEVVQHIYDRVSQQDFTNMKTPNHYIAVENGILDVLHGKLLPFSPDYFLLNKLHVRYDPTAKCPRIERYLDGVTDGDPVKKAWLIEIAGLTIWRGSNQFLPLIAFLHGSGSNGKSVYLSLLKSFLGAENTIQMDIQSLENNRFASARIEFKLACLGPDISDQCLRRAGVVKAISSGDRITVERKGQDSFEIDPFAQLIFSCNSLPRIMDTSDASLRRLMVVPFTHSFENDPNKDPEILEKITTPDEMSGFLNLCLDAITRIRKNGNLSNRPPVHEMAMFYQTHSDPVLAFVEHEVEEDQEGFILKHEFYKKLREFCVKNKIKIPTQRQVGERLQEVIPCYGGRTSARGPRVWRGISWRNLKSEREEQKKLTHINQVGGDTKAMGGVLVTVSNSTGLSREQQTVLNLLRRLEKRNGKLGHDIDSIFDEAELIRAKISNFKIMTILTELEQRKIVFKPTSRTYSTSPRRGDKS